MTQQLGNPVYDGSISTGQLTLSGSAGDQFASASTIQGIRQLWIATPSANTGNVYMGNSASTNANGVPIPPGQRVLVPLDRLGLLYFHGTAADKVAYEAYR